MSTFTVINPTTAAPVKDIALAGIAETDAIISKAARAFESWRNVTPGDRAKLLRKFASIVDDHNEELAKLEVLNSGHTIGNARWEAGNVRDVLNYYSAAPERLFGRQIPVPNGIDVTFKEPLGVIGVIVPWNFPMPIAGWGFAPALADVSIVIFDDANWEGVVSGATLGIKESGLTVLYEKKVLNSEEDPSQWWNGLYILVLSKH